LAQDARIEAAVLLDLPQRPVPHFLSPASLFFLNEFPAALSEYKNK